MQGDALAAGAKSAVFRTGGQKVDEVGWDLMVLSREEFEAKWPGRSYEQALEERDSA